MTSTLDQPAAAGPGGPQPGHSAGPAAPGGWDWVAAPPPPPPDRFTLFFTRLWARSPRWAAPVAILACIAGASGYVLAVDPTDANADAVPTCLLKLTTGFDCPGCGGTRAFWYVLHGSIPAAARHHALFVFGLPFLLYAYIAWAGREVFRWRLPMPRVTPRAVGFFLAAWGVFTVLRNLPWAPFTWLYV
ncbi:MAG TPA: DUF2752 domain-containing protein [Micromonosporaceae bacterium]|nr:DUF2752 domain-containing protein [Micromonosporaceae bacterium]